MKHGISREDSAPAIQVAVDVIARADIPDWAFWATYLLERLEEDQEPADDLYVEMLENLIVMCVHRIDNGEWQ